MDHYVSQQLPLAIRAFQLSRLPFKVIQHYWKQKQTKFAFVGGLTAVTFILWKIGSARNKRNIQKSTIQQKNVPAVDILFLTRLARLLRVCIPKVNSWECIHVVALVVLLLSRTFLSIGMAEAMGASAKSLTEGDLTMFIKNLGKMLLIVIPASLVNCGLKYFTNMLALYCRRRLTLEAHEKYLTNTTFFRTATLNQRKVIDNCEMRITQDIEKFSLACSHIFASTFKPLLDVALLTRKLSLSVGIKGPVIVYTYFLITGVLLRSVLPSFANLYAGQQKCETEFRQSHARLMSHAEEIAFYGGTECEKAIVNQRFQRIFSQNRNIFRLQAFVDVVDSWLVKYGATMVGYVVVSLPVFARGNSVSNNFGSVSSARVGDFISNTQLLVHLDGAIGQLMLLYKRLLSLSRYSTRVSELFDALDALNLDAAHPNKYVEQFISQEENKELLREFHPPEIVRGNTIAFDQVNIYSPSGKLLIKNLNFETKAGSNLLITGPNGCGKSSLFRILCRLWPLHCGKITRPANREMFYVPQRPYSPLGTLRDQVIYPLSREQMLMDGHSDDDLQTLLENVNLVYLLKRSGGWDAVEEWEETLSSGEKQRLAMARIFFHKPRYAILDECTNAVSVDVEAYLYQHSKEIGITLITISHRDVLRKFHENVLTFDENGDWSFTKLNEDYLSM